MTTQSDEQKARKLCEEQGWDFDGIDADGETFGYIIPGAVVGRQTYRLDQIPNLPGPVAKGA